MSGDARAGAPGEDPRPRRLGGLEQALAQALLEARLELEVGLAAVDGDEELGLLEAPLAEQEGEDELWPGVVGQADVLKDTSAKKNSLMCSPTNCAYFVLVLLDT